jgi:hypothetical protein
VSPSRQTPLIVPAARLKSEAYMRKNTSFAVAATMMGMAMLFWAKSSMVASSADVRQTAGMSPYLTTISYLPFRTMEPVY